MVKIYYNGDLFSFVHIYGERDIGVYEAKSNTAQEYKHHHFYATGALKTFLKEGNYKEVK